MFDIRCPGLLGWIGARPQLVKQPMSRPWQMDRISFGFGSLLRIYSENVSPGRLMLIEFGSSLGICSGTYVQISF